MLHKNIISAIGNTPLVKINFDSPATIYAKLEHLNPGGSVKDRSSIFMIEEAEQKGLLKPGGTIIDASSGNQGIAVAMIGAAKKYNVIITVTEKISKEKLDTLKAYGAKVVMCPPVSTIEDPRSYHNIALEIQKNTPNSFMPNQYYNESNRLAHQTFLGPEIWEQTEGKITHFFAAAGTGGTISGVGRYLKSKNPNIKIIAADSNNSYRSTKGHAKPYEIEGMGIDFDSPVTDYSTIDEIIEIADKPALDILKPLARKHGFLVGLSSGAVAHMTQQYLPKMKAGDLGVMIFGDSGRAYLSKGFYSEDSDQVISYKEVLNKNTVLEL